MANRSKRTRKKDNLFFEQLAMGSTVTYAAQTAGYARRSVFEWKLANKEFGKRWQESIDTAIERMEAEADRRAIEGTKKPVYQGGELVGYINEYSDTLLIFRLKALAPSKYRDNQRVEHTGPEGKPIEVEVSARDKLAHLLSSIAAREGENEDDSETDGG